MTSKILKSVAADSNVLLSAVIGKAALKIFTYTNLEILTTRFNVLEVEEYLPFLSSKYDLDIKQLWVQLKMLPIQIIEVGEYKSHLPFAQEHLGQRDMDDIHLAALALIKNIPIWSNDRDFENIPHITLYPTAKLLKLFHL
jgi:predicted nucleic acid-binding protein